jgi:hypothetical protein
MGAEKMGPIILVVLIVHHTPNTTYVKALKTSISMRDLPF